MDLGESDGGSPTGFRSSGDEPTERKRALPADLPKTLDDRKHVSAELMPEIELYDGWQGWFPLTTTPTPSNSFTDDYPGQSQFLTSPMLAKPLTFGELSLNDTPRDDDKLAARGGPDSEARLMEMIAAQAAHSAGGAFEDEDAVASDEKRSETEKKELLQRALTMAASNGNVDSVRKILGGKAKEYVDVNAPDEDGTPPLIYASCFVSLHDLALGLPATSADKLYRATKAWFRP